MTDKQEDFFMSYLDEDYMSTTSQSSSWTQFQETGLYPEVHYFPLINFLQELDVSHGTLKGLQQFISTPQDPVVKPKRGRKKREPTIAPTKPPVPILPAQKDSQKKEQVEKEASKRQERLIKNRAAALLSRKRKRDHLNSLEEDKNNLLNENLTLKETICLLEKEKVQLKTKLKEEHGQNNNHGMILMV